MGCEIRIRNIGFNSSKIRRTKNCDKPAQQYKIVGASGTVVMQLCHEHMLQLAKKNNFERIETNTYIDEG